MTGTFGGFWRFLLVGSDVLVEVNDLNEFCLCAAHVLDQDRGGGSG